MEDGVGGEGVGGIKPVGGGGGQPGEALEGAAGCEGLVEDTDVEELGVDLVDEL